jgi:hypothetical protein
MPKQPRKVSSLRDLPAGHPMKYADDGVLTDETVRLKAVEPDTDLTAAASAATDGSGTEFAR